MGRTVASFEHCAALFWRFKRDEQGEYTRRLLFQLQALRQAAARARRVAENRAALPLLLEDGLIVAARVVPQLHAHVQRMEAAVPDLGTADDDDDLAFLPLGLFRLGWLALELGLTADALKLLGVVGALKGGPLGAAELQASALAERDAAAAASLLERAIAATPDERGRAAALLASLWRDAGDERWVALARQVSQHATDPEARSLCRILIRNLM